MSKYQIYRDLMRFRIVKDGRPDWSGRYTLSPSGYGFEANDCLGRGYILESRGVFFWRKLSLYREGQLIDQFKPYRSREHCVTLKRGSDIFVAGREVFSFRCKRELTEYGHRIACWEFSDRALDPTIYSLILLWEQGRGQPFGLGV